MVAGLDTGSFFGHAALRVVRALPSLIPTMPGVAVMTPRGVSFHAAPLHPEPGQDLHLLAA